MSFEPVFDAPPNLGDQNALLARTTRVPDDWLIEDPPQRKFLMRDVRTGRGALGERGVCLLVAAGGAGKSYCTLALILAISTGTLWVGAFKPEKPGRVLYLTAEESADEVRERLWNVLKAANLSTIAREDIDVVDVHDKHTPLLNKDGQITEHLNALVDLVRTRGPYDIVVLDPLARIAGANIDGDNVAAGAIVGALEAVSTAAQGLVVVLHHTDKAARRQGIKDATSVRGASGIGDSARMVLILSVEDVETQEVVTLECVKANHVKKWAPVEMVRGEGGELYPLDEEGRRRAEESRHTLDPVEQRFAAREAASARRTALEEERRAARETATKEKALQRDDEVDGATLASVRDEPGILARELRKVVRVLARCGANEADLSVTRCVKSGRLRREIRGKKVLHFPSTS